MAARFPDALWALGLSSLLVLASCATQQIDPDVGPSDGGPLSLELGTGEHAFTTIAEGETLLLARGCQGLQHVWIALRATGIAPRGVRVQLVLTRQSDAALVSATFDTAITFSPDPTGSSAELTGLMLVVTTPADGLGVPLVLHGIITDRAGRTTNATRFVTLAWGTGVCGA